MIRDKHEKLTSWKFKASISEESIKRGFYFYFFEYFTKDKVSFPMNKDINVKINSKECKIRLTYRNPNNPKYRQYPSTLIFIIYNLDLLKKD